MKRFIVGVVLAIVSSSSFAAWELPQNYQNMTKSKRVCVRRDTETLEGYVITYWNRDGRPDWILPPVETNAVKKMHGKKQNNAIENDRDKQKKEKEEAIVERDIAKKEAEPANKIRACKKNAAKKDQQNLNKAIKEMEKARDKSSEAMYDLYQSILDLLNEANSAS